MYLHTYVCVQAMEKSCEKDLIQTYDCKRASTSRRVRKVGISDLFDKSGEPREVLNRVTG
jgi:hypothetical protein